MGSKRNDSRSKSDRSVSRSRSRDRSARRSRDRRSPSVRNGSRASAREENRKISSRRQSRSKTYTFEIKLENEDAGFLQGKKGRTKMKLERVSGVKLDIDGDKLVISGSSTNKINISKAEKYCKCLIQQRKGMSDKKLMDELLTDRDQDLTELKVPQAAVAFVTGKQGCFLRQTEEDWEVLMFFSEFDKDRKSEDRAYENLAIFGKKRNRRGAELKILSAMESKCPGYFKDNEKAILERDNDPNDESIIGTHTTDDIGENYEHADWKTDVLKFKDDELSFALGRQGATRRKLEASSSCIVQYIGQFALFSGTAQQRSRIKLYLRWLFEQLDAPVNIPNAQDRDDLTLVDVPQDCVGYITGVKRQALSQIEADNGVLMFFVGKGKSRSEPPGDDPNETERLAIFGPERGRLASMLRVWWSVDLKSPGKFSDLIPGENRSEWSRDKVGLDYMLIGEEDVGYTLGKKGATKIKIVNASHCELQYLGKYACMVGTLAERRNCKDYINWLLDQRKGRMCIDTAGRDDIVEKKVTQDFISWVNSGNCGTELRAIEEETKTFMFLASSTDRANEDRLMICATREGHEALGFGRHAGEMKIKYLMADLDAGRFRPRNTNDITGYRGGGNLQDHRGGGRMRGGRGGDSRRRDRSRGGRRGRGDSRRRRGGGGGGRKRHDSRDNRRGRGRDSRRRR